MASLTAFAARPERIIVLTRQGCHLCEDAIAQVAAVCSEIGEAYTVLDVDSDPELQRRYTDQVPVTFVEAALGADIEVPTLKGPKVRLRIPAGTPNGRTFRVRGKGVRKGTGEHGDLLVTVGVQVPAHLDAALLNDAGHKLAVEHRAEHRDDIGRCDQGAGRPLFLQAALDILDFHRDIVQRDLR